MAQPKLLKILSLETSCDETGAAVIIGGRIKSNILLSQIKIHQKFGGVVPEVAAREHVTSILPIIDAALKKAKINLKNIDAIAVTRGPGLATSLMVGIDTAKALAVALNKPLLPINHLEAHIYANFINKIPQFPALILIVSGGHTMLVLMRGYGQPASPVGRYKIVGETVDDAAGEAFDKTARLLGLPYPGGPSLSKLSEKGNSKAFDFPRPMINAKTLNFSFSGLKTAVLYTVQKLSPKTHNLKADLAASVQQAIVDVLIAKTEQAVKIYKPKTIMLGGGVSANNLLRRKFSKLAKKHHLASSVPKLEYCTDNAAMIGLAAYFKVKSKKSKVKSHNFSAQPNLRLK